ncbi:hypothetical protein D3C81_1663820 [compost metagenome]
MVKGQQHLAPQHTVQIEKRQLLAFDGLRGVEQRQVIGAQRPPSWIAECIALGTHLLHVARLHPGLLVQGPAGGIFQTGVGGTPIHDDPGQGPLPGMRLALTTVQQHLQMLGIRGQAQGDNVDTGQDFDCTHRAAPCSVAQ